MSEIGNIKLELLRPGPAHNQLLSPLTTYIALVGNEGPVTVHFPFEHRQLLNRLEQMRYFTPSGPVPPSQRESEVRNIGELLGDVLGNVPALLSEIGKAKAGGKGLVHLRLSLSAFELALVPFEFVIAPEGFPGSGSPLFLQSLTPITLTREVRRGRPLPVQWNRAPRILFAFACPQGLAPVPAQDHLNALRRAVEPWVKWKANPMDRLGEVKSLITVLPNATLEKIREACEGGFTHVHILAHGAPFEIAGDRRYGVVLCSENSTSGMDVVDGERLAIALTAKGPEGAPRNRPTFLSLATCDAGNTGSVLTPGGSIAHELHAAGIPWVIASQFPLTMHASSIAAEVLYSQLLRGDDPRSVLYEVRQRLRTGSAGTHDWAGIVAYASVPWDFERQVEAFRNRQRRTCLDLQFDKAEQEEFDGIESLYQTIRRDLTAWVGSLPPSASHKELSERLGMCGASEKRMGILFDRNNDIDRARVAYTAALEHYGKALEADPLNHWVTAQFLSIRAVLAVKEGVRQEVIDSLRLKYGDWWVAARQIARWQLRSASKDERAWALGTLAELEMLGVIYGTGFDKQKAMGQIEQYCTALCENAGNGSFPVFSTRRQFERYLDPWNWGEWKDLASAAVSALGEAKCWTGGPYLGPGGTEA
ncbi:MAG: CHAT domain-containing protein [Desulfobacteraceae bacterium]|nr:CHAT domain-containing protein [Desulfobacteraceae bacterium]